MTARLSVRIEGLDKLIRNCKASSLLGPPLKTAFKRAAILAEGDARKWAPFETRRLASSVTSEIDSRPVPLWAKYGTAVKYARPLDQPVSRRPHYRRGPHKGQETANWLSGAVKRRLDDIRDVFARAGRDIEERWRR